MQAIAKLVGAIAHRGHTTGAEGGPSGRRHRHRLGGAMATILVIAFLPAVSIPGHAGAVSSFHVTGSWEQVFVTDAPPGATLELIQGGSVVATATADAQGSMVFRNVAPGTGYTVRSSSPAEESDPVLVHSETEAHPPQSWYDAQTIPTTGYGYLTTRDGTTLSINVYLPGPIEDGPYPTVVEYSGYDPSRPNSPIAASMGLDAATQAALCPDSPVICHTPAQPASELINALEYAVVAVNIRGTGCSGGAYDFFETLQSLDGYDVIETVAAQPWVRDHKVAMVGLSYPGISQLFVAATQPPSLAAIAPLAVMDDGAALMVPGGMYNIGFAFEWVERVLSQAVPNGPNWVRAQISNGDTVCANNQKLRLQNIDLTEIVRQYRYRDPAVADPLSPMTFAHKINVPVFLAGAWQDEQTGPRWSRLYQALTNAPFKRMVGYNGYHPDGYSPEVLSDWKAFLDYEFAHERRDPPALVAAFLPQAFEGTFGVALPFPLDRWSGNTAEATQKYEAQPPVRIIMERGRVEPYGAPLAGFEVALDDFPAPNTQPDTWYFQPDGSLQTAEPSFLTGASEYTVDASRRGLTTQRPGGTNLWSPLPDYVWTPEPEGTAVRYLTAPLDEAKVYIGGGSVDLWVRSSVPQTEVEVTLTEIRPDGTEMFVQNGWLRSDLRTPGPDATALFPDQRALEGDASSLPVGDWEPMRVELQPSAHIFRAGSRLQISIHAPGGNMSNWTLETDASLDGTTVEVGHHLAHASKLVLPLVPGIWGFADDLAECPPNPDEAGQLLTYVRGQPCRNYVALANRISEVAAPIPTTTTTTTTTSTTTTTTTTSTTVPATTGSTTTPTTASESTSTTTTTTTAPETGVLSATSTTLPAVAVVVRPVFTG